jgi:hypothetical protein
VELRARSGRAVLVGVEDTTRREWDPSGLRLPTALVDGLHEWARTVDALGKQEDAADDSARLVSWRGRQLAMRLAVETGGEVGYVDPISGEINRVGWRRPARHLPARGTGIPAPPTPWATGLAVSAIIAALATVALIVVTLGLAQVNGLLAVFINLAVVAGFVPSIWLGRRVPVWRWVAFGAAGGIVLAWIALLLSLLG